MFELFIHIRVINRRMMRPAGGIHQTRGRIEGGASAPSRNAEYRGRGKHPSRDAEYRGRGPGRAAPRETTKGAKGANTPDSYDNEHYTARVLLLPREITTRQILLL